MEELVEEIKKLKLELNDLKEKVNQLPQTEYNQLENNKKRKFNKFDDVSAKNNISLNNNLPNRNKRWSPKEEEDLQDELKNELNITEIAKNHGRSKLAIEYRIKKIVEDKLITQSLESISNDLKLDIAFLKKLNIK